MPKMLCNIGKRKYLCTRFSEMDSTGCSAVRLAHLPWAQGVAGSNPVTPTLLHFISSQTRC